MMSVRGWVNGCKLVNQGSELTAAAATSATSLAVEWVGDFDDTGGTLRLNGVDLAYSSVDETASTVTLAVPLAAAAAVGDRVDVVTAGQVLKDYTLFVTLGVGDDAEVDIPFGDRDAWPEGDYDDPVEVLLSDDLERIESVPGVLPVRRIIGGYIATTDGEETQRFVIRDDGNGGIVESFSGLPDEVPGSINPGDITGFPAITIRPGTTPTQTDQPHLEMYSDNAGGSIKLDAGSVVVGESGQGQVIVDKALTGFDLFVDDASGTGTLGTSGGINVGTAFYSPALPSGSEGTSVIMRPADGRLQIDSSTRRHKDDEQPIDEAALADRLLQLQPKSYTRRDDDDPGRRHLGVIAEDAADLGLPLVVLDVEGAPLSMNRGAFVAALLATAREQQRQIDRLTERVAQLEEARQQ